MDSMLVFVIIVCALTFICIALAITCLVFYNKTWWEWLLPVGIFSGIFGFLGILASLISIGAYDNLQKEYNVCIAKIVSLERDNLVSGRFCLGSGVIEEKEYYFYYVQVKENTYKLNKLECANAYIVETDQYEPSIYKIKVKGELEYQNIYVPFGTMVVKYSV